MYEEICMVQRKCPAAEVNLQAGERGNFARLTPSCRQTR